jgi:hypothetical protein
MASKGARVDLQVLTTQTRLYQLRLHALIGQILQLAHRLPTVQGNIGSSSKPHGYGARSVTPGDANTGRGATQPRYEYFVIDARSSRGSI